MDSNNIKAFKIISAASLKLIGGGINFENPPPQPNPSLNLIGQGTHNAVQGIAAANVPISPNVTVTTIVGGSTVTHESMVGISITGTF